MEHKSILLLKNIYIYFFKWNIRVYASFKKKKNLFTHSDSNFPSSCKQLQSILILLYTCRKWFPHALTEKYKCYQHLYFVSCLLPEYNSVSSVTKSCFKKERRKRKKKEKKSLKKMDLLQSC